MEHAATGRFAKSGHPWRAETLHRISVIKAWTNPFRSGSVQLALTMRLGFLFLKHSVVADKAFPRPVCQGLQRQQPSQVPNFELQYWGQPKTLFHHWQQGLQPGASPNPLWAVTSAGKQTGNPAVYKAGAPKKACPEGSHPACLLIWNI